MNRFLNQTWRRLTNIRRAGTATPPRRSYRPLCESLERRDVMSTLYIVPTGSSTNSTHFHDFDSAYQAATAGDVIQVQHHASVASVGAGITGNRVAGGAINTNTITIDNSKICAGEWVTVTTGNNQDIVLVQSAQGNGQGGVTLTFNQKLGSDHTGAGTTVVTNGELGIAKAITLQGDPHHSQAPVTSAMELPSGTAHVIFNNLDFTNKQGLTVDDNHQFITVEHSTLPFLGMNIGAGNQSDVLDHDHFTGAVVVNGDGAYLTADRVTNNLFTGSGNLYMINNGDSLVSGNVFNVTYAAGDLPSATIFNCPSILLYGNTFTVHNATGNTTALALSYSSFFPQYMLAYVENNTFNTGGNGVGIDITGPLDAMIQGNDFRYNAVGVYLYGDGSTVGTVDLGGGPLGSSGHNNFSTFTVAGTANGHFAISMHNTSTSDTVYALHNSWSTFFSSGLVKDHYEHTNVADAVYTSYPSPGTGNIIAFQLLVRLPVVEPIGLKMA